MIITILFLSALSGILGATLSYMTFGASLGSFVAIGAGYISGGVVGFIICASLLLLKSTRRAVPPPYVSPTRSATR